MDATLFDLAAERLGHHTRLNRLAARGTLRIALKSAGLTVKSVTARNLCVVFEKVMPGELDSRGVSGVQAVCAAVLADLQSAGGAAEDASATSPEEVFRRLSGG